MSQREEVLDMAVHALTPLMRGARQGSAEDQFDRSVEIGRKLIAKVDQTVAQEDDAPSRDVLMDMGVHALSALLNGRQPASVDEVLDECMDVAQALVARADEALASGGGETDREELLDVAVHVQTALLNSRPKMDANELADQCVAIAQKLIAKVDAEVG